MADDEKENVVTPTRGAEWEVVQLTASTYAAAPGPKGFVPDDEGNEQEPSSAMFMSDHFIFPPSEHENLQIEPEYSGIQNEAEVQDVSPVEDVGDGSYEIEEEISCSKSDTEKHEIRFFDNGCDLSVPNVEFDEDPKLNLPEEKEVKFASSESNVSSGENQDSPKYTGSKDDDKYDGSGLPCEAWWKRHAACLYHHAKEANTLWSVVVAAALMGLVILGKQWQQDKWRINDEKLNRVLGPVGRFKDVLVGGSRGNPLTRDGAAARR